MTWYSFYDTILDMATKRGTSYYAPVQKLPVNQLHKDLLRTIIVTIIMLGLMAGLYYWMGRGGWAVLSKIWQYGR